jgi:teichuronic acid biosynthesis glycosyltransferase TuaC
MSVNATDTALSAEIPRILVFSSLYPSQVRPVAGVFIRERMSKVAEHCPLLVVSPVPWFPLQGLIRRFYPNYRPQPASREEQNGIQVLYPKFLSLPAVGRSLDGFFMAVCCLPLLFNLRRHTAFNLIDAHFTYPDGYAATLLGGWLKLPVCITLRGTEAPLLKTNRRGLLLKALRKATKVFSVSAALKQLVVDAGAEAEKIQVVGNGIDIQKFFPIDKLTARRQFGIAEHAPVLISVGGLVDRKGFHRVLEIMPQLLAKYPDLVYLIVGGASPEGDIRERLERQVAELGLAAHVRFLGSMAAKDLHQPLSAADVFVLATANEGWANVFLEAMACGLPVISTDVGGNREVVCAEHLGAIVPFGEPQALSAALDAALQRDWDRQAILRYAAENSWDTRTVVLLAEFRRLVNV